MNDRSGGVGSGTTKSFPSPEWIAQRVQARVEGLSNDKTCNNELLVSRF
jgi:hypothetical protein